MLCGKREQAMHYSTDCYVVKALPVKYQITQHTGYSCIACYCLRKCSHSLEKLSWVQRRAFSWGSTTQQSHLLYQQNTVWHAHCIALNFCRSFISWIFNSLQKYFNGNFWHAACSVHVQRIHELISTKSNCYSRKFTPSKIWHYTVVLPSLRSSRGKSPHIDQLCSKYLLPTAFLHNC